MRQTDRPTIEDCIKYLQKMHGSREIPVTIEPSHEKDAILKFQPEEDENFYDTGIDIDSLHGFISGWSVFGKQCTAVPKNDGRVIGILGDFKSGKCLDPSTK